MTKASRKNEDESANDRVVIGDNMPPEPVGLPTAADIALTASDEIVALRKDAAALRTVLKRVPAKIENAEVYARATTLGGQLQKLAKSIDDKRKKAKKPYLDAGRAVDAQYDLKVVEGEGDAAVEVDLGTEIKNGHATIKRLLGDYDTEQLRIETAARIEAATKLAEAAAKDGIVMDVAAANADAVKGGSTRSEHGGLAVRNIVREYEIVDVTLVPASLCSPDPAKIRAAIDAGAVTIPGIRIDERVNTHVKG